MKCENCEKNKPTVHARPLKDVHVCEQCYNELVKKDVTVLRHYKKTRKAELEKTK